MSLGCDRACLYPADKGFGLRGDAPRGAAGVEIAAGRGERSGSDFAERYKQGADDAATEARHGANKVTHTIHAGRFGRRSGASSKHVRTARTAREAMMG